MLYKEGSDAPELTRSYLQPFGNEGRPKIQKNNRFSHTGVGVTKAEEKKDSDLEMTNQRLTQLHASEESNDLEQDLMEKETDKKSLEETNRPSTYNVVGVYDPLPILARGKGFDEEPEAA